MGGVGLSDSGGPGGLLYATGFAGVAYFNQIGLSVGLNDEKLISTLLHELYHVGQYFSNAFSLPELVKEQIFDDHFGPREKQAYAARVAFDQWSKTNGSCKQ